MKRQIRLKDITFQLNQLSEYENLIVKHGEVVEVDEESDKAILAKWRLSLGGYDYDTGYIWIPKSLLEITE